MQKKVKDRKIIKTNKRVSNLLMKYHKKNKKKNLWNNLKKQKLKMKGLDKTMNNSKGKNRKKS